MKRLLITICLSALVACVSSSAQTRPRPASTPTNRGRATQAKPTKPATTPATRTTPPAATPATGQSTAGGAGAADECGCEAKPLPAVLAVVNGVNVTPADLTEETRQQVRQLQNQVVEARRNEVGLIINSKLLEAEAKKRATTTAKLIQEEILSKVVEPTDAEMQTFYTQNKTQIDAQAGRSVAFADVKNDIAEFLRRQRQDVAAKSYADRLRAAAQVKILVEAATPPTTAADRARLFATVNGERITSGDVEDNLRPLIFTVQERVYELRKTDVDLRINDLLLEQEAQKRKVPTKTLLDTEITAKIPTIGDAEAQTFYNQNKERINGEFAQLKPQILDYLRQREQQKAESTFAQQLRNGASIQTFITPPEPPVYQIATDDQPTRGNPSASVTLVEFTDYQCPSCAQTQPVVERIATEYADRVRVVIRDFPLNIHDNAFKAAEAAEAAREQGKYWEYVGVLFLNQSALQPDKLKQYATQLGLDRAKFDAALDSGRFAEKVQRDLLDGTRLGVGSTPTLFVNGRRIEDRSYEGLKAAIDAALRGSAKK